MGHRAIISWVLGVLGCSLALGQPTNLEQAKDLRGLEQRASLPFHRHSMAGSCPRAAPDCREVGNCGQLAQDLEAGLMNF